MSLGYDVWAVLGQSNTAYGDGFDPAIDVPHSRVDQLAARGPMVGQVLPATEPLLHPVATGTRIGFGLAFARAHVALVPQQRRILLVPVGKGGSGFRPWAGYTWDRHDRTTPFNLYRFATMQISAALALPGSNRLAGVLWHQGEHDTGPDDAPGYGERLDDLVLDLRAQFGASMLFLAGQMNPDHIDLVRAVTPGYLTVDRIHREIGERIPGAAFVQGPRGRSNSELDTIHYSAAGQRELGRRYAAAAEQLLAGPRRPAAVELEKELRRQ